jgi:hypothetical protein
LITLAEKSRSLSESNVRLDLLLAPLEELEGLACAFGLKCFDEVVSLHTYKPAERHDCQKKKGH